jgi:hypothetical protein
MVAQRLDDMPQQVVSVFPALDLDLDFTIAGLRLRDRDRCTFAFPNSFLLAFWPTDTSTSTVA